MKTRIALLFTLALAAGCSSSNHYPSLTRNQTEKMVGDNILLRRYTIDVNRAVPLGGRSINLTSPYTLEIKGDSVYSHLPYYGRAYSVPYGGGKGMIFSFTVSDYSATPGRKGETVVKFTTRTQEDRHQFTVTLWPNGSADINVLPTNRQAINYTGRMRLETAQ
ncbi:MAG: DUF4251 domain-containing protein [Alistipes sp.]|nr:DUF4251 domain-containing protein [Alistipes sp.]